MKQGVALVLVRLLALYLGFQFAQTLANNTPALVRFGDRHWSSWVPHVAGLAIALGVWLTAPAIARLVARGADPAGGADQAGAPGRITLDERAVTIVVEVALLILGLSLAARAVFTMAFNLASVSSPFGIIETDPSWYSRNGPSLIANTLQLAFGLLLVFRGRAMSAALVRMRQWWAPTPEDDEEDDSSKPTIEWR